VKETILGRPRCRWEDIKLDLQEGQWGGGGGDKPDCIGGGVGRGGGGGGVRWGEVGGGGGGGGGGTDQIDLAQDWYRWKALLIAVMNLQFT
jgi:hypothetical protein